MARISKIKLLFITLFICIITLNFVVYAFIKNKDTKDTFENRNRTEFPSLINGDYKTYFTAIENYFSDNFIFKYKYINGINKARNTFFNANNANKKVIFGKQGWMFFNACIYSEKGMDEYCGLFPWLPAQAKSVVDKLKTIQHFCDKNNIIFIPIICPNKHTIYPEYLPDIYKKYQHNRYDELMIQGKDYFVNYSTVFLAEKAKLPCPLYYKTDTHWNYLGAYFATIEVSKAINKIHPDFSILSLNDISIEQQKSHVGRDLANMVVLNNDVDEINVDIKLNTKIPKKMNKAFIIHDSFYDYMTPMMKELFNTIDERGFTKPLTAKEIINAKPDVFIYEVVERNLDEMGTNLDENFYK